MKNPLVIASLIVISVLLPACGKVADPLPPVVQVPEPVADFAVSQVGYQLRFEWTNPARNVDATAATELTRAVIRSESDTVLDVPTQGPGQFQTAELDARPLVGSSESFAIEIQSGPRRLSAPSAPFPITVLAVPGPVGDLRAIVDQGRITLDWSLPLESQELTDAVRIYRSNQLLADLSGQSTMFEDQPYVAGGTYTYVVVAGRLRSDGEFLEGVAAPALEVQAVDVTPPGTPRGLGLRAFADGAFLAWDPAPEADIAGYRLSRRENQGVPFLPIREDLLVVTGYNDVDYAPGYAYRVSAVDRSGNESPWSESVD